MKVEVNIKDAAKALRLIADELYLLGCRREVNRQLREIKLRRVALALDTMEGPPRSPNKKAPSRNRGRRRTGQGVSTKRNIAHSDAARKVKNFIDIKSAELARVWTSWREEDAR